MTTGSKAVDEKLAQIAAAAPPLSPEQFALISGLMRRNVMASTETSTSPRRLSAPLAQGRAA